MFRTAYLKSSFHLEAVLRCGGGSVFTVPLYGFTKWRDVFTPRQLLTLSVFVRHTRDAAQRLRLQDQDASQGRIGNLTIVFGKLADYMSSLCLWSGANDEVLHTFSRYALPITWDFAEANPFTESARFYSGGLEVACRSSTSLHIG